MIWLLLQTLGQILRFEYYVRHDDFALLYQQVSLTPLIAQEWSTLEIERICNAINVVCVWYPKRVLCLQRSAATVCLLRSYGIPAQLVIGAQQIPFRAHAWVEVQGRIVNDKSYAAEIYQVLDRC